MSAQVVDLAPAPDEAKARWARGQVVPHRITLALNLRELYGPEVDLACGAKEPDVDQWEAGEKYPAWPQLLALATLTGFDVRFFTPEPDQVHALGPGTMFVCSRSRRKRDPRVEIPEPVLAFTPDAVTATVDGYCVACLDPKAGGRALHTCE